MALHFRKVGAENDRDIAPPKQRHCLAPCTAWCQCTRSTIRIGWDETSLFHRVHGISPWICIENHLQAEKSMQQIGSELTFMGLMELLPPCFLWQRRKRWSSHGALPRLLGESGHAISGRSCLGCFGGVFLGLFPCWLWGFQAEFLDTFLRAFSFSCWVFEG